MNSSGQQNGSGPCGACKFLRRKCVKGCIFAPYFDPEQGTSHFAAVHKVFGASNASKMLLRVPANKRLDVVVTLCYEALARIRDPVYGCVGHLFTLQQQVVNLQAELACAQARLCTLHRLPPHQMLPLPTMQFSPSPTNLDQPCSSNVSLQASMEMASCFADSINDQQQDLEDGGDDLHALAQGFVSKYFHGGVKFNCKPSTSP